MIKEGIPLLLLSLARGADCFQDPAGAGYVENWRACPTADQTDGFKTLLISSAVTSDGSPGMNSCNTRCEIGSPVPVCDNQPNALLVSQWQTDGKKVILEFGDGGMDGSGSRRGKSGGGGDDCWEYCFGKEGFVAKQLIDIILSQGFDGIDVDFNYQSTDPRRDAKGQLFVHGLTQKLLQQLPADKVLSHGMLAKPFPAPTDPTTPSAPSISGNRWRRPPSWRKPPSRRPGKPGCVPTPPPCTPTPQPTAATPQPTTATPQPTTATPQPTAATPQPTPQPTTATPQPTTATPEPTPQPQPPTAVPTSVPTSVPPTVPSTPQPTTATPTPQTTPLPTTTSPQTTSQPTSQPPSTPQPTTAPQPPTVQPTTSPAPQPPIVVTPQPTPVPTSPPTTAQPPPSETQSPPAPTPQPEEGESPTPQPDGESPTPQPEEGGEPTPQPEEGGVPTPQPEEGESPTPQPEGESPTPQPEEGGEPTPQPEEGGVPTPQPEEGESPTPQPEEGGGPTPQPEEGGVPTPQPEEGGGPTPQPEEGGVPTPQPEEGGGPTPQPEEGGVPTPQPEEGESPTPQPEEGGGPTPQPEEGGVPTPQPEEGGGPTPQPEEGGVPTPQPEEGGGPTPQPEEGGVPTPQPEEGESPTPQPEEEGGESPTPQPEEEGEEGGPTPQPEEGGETPTPQPEEEGEEGGPTPQPEEGEEGGPTPQPEEGEEGGPFPGEGEGERINSCGETISEWGHCIAAPHCCSEGLKCFQRRTRSARCVKACDGEGCREIGAGSTPVLGRELGEKAPVCGKCESWQKGGAYCTGAGKGAKDVCSAIPKSGSCSAGKTKCFRGAGGASRARKLVRLVLRRGMRSFVKKDFRNMLQGLFELEAEISFKFICPSSACPGGICGGDSSSKCLKLDGTDSRKAAALGNDGKEAGSVVAFEIEGGSDRELVRAFNKKQLPGVVAMHEEWRGAAAGDDETAMTGTEGSKNTEKDEKNKSILPFLIGAVSAVVGCVLIAVAAVFYRRPRSGGDDDFCAGDRGIDMTSLTTMDHPAVGNNEEKKDFVSELRI